MNTKLQEKLKELQNKIDLGYSYSKLTTTQQRDKMAEETGVCKKTLHYYKKQRFIFAEIIEYLETVTQKDIERMNYMYSYALNAPDHKIYNTTFGTACNIAEKIFITDESRKRRVKTRMGSRASRCIDPPLEKPQIMQKPETPMFFEDEKNIPQSKHSYVAVSGAYGSHLVGGGSFEMME
jgi:hypothetical protein